MRPSPEPDPLSAAAVAVALVAGMLIALVAVSC